MRSMTNVIKLFWYSLRHYWCNLSQSLKVICQYWHKLQLKYLYNFDTSAVGSIIKKFGSAYATIGTTLVNILRYYANSGVNYGKFVL